MKNMTFNLSGNFWKKIILLAAGLLVLATVFFTVKTIKERYFQKDGAFEEKSGDGLNEQSFPPAEEQNNEIDEDRPGEFLEPEDAMEDEEAERELEEDRKEEVLKENFLEIDRKDCENRCRDFEKKKNELRYCREFCGLNPIISRKTTRECEDLDDLEEDYCLRDVAVSKKDYSICEMIEDAGIERMCQNRITEDLINGR